ncbi:nucleotidyltransferase family protein [Macrococcoides canis]|uniref:nucleotidyltransferase family protein n=1 Tax=Macrococcoides canis TaxID=1855823 RepID=UPI0020B85857|nr:nucleotidyltransferase family protein [Macrococcus canis]UTH00864.1 nucleotidyltransferase family protein [Macrococcus canis]UTH03229.1 nucleotidyltransferase family protein [Macrococcus canis]
MIENLIYPNITVKDALKKLDKSKKKILFVVEPNHKLLGSITDGDIRRHILSTGNLLSEVSTVMNANPISTNQRNDEEISKIIVEKSIKALPIVNEKKIIEEIVYDDGIKEVINNEVESLNNIPVVIMAGGKGTRLKPYTNILPKPLIPIGEVPIVQRIMDKFINHGTNNFVMSVNYKKNMIKAYFDDDLLNYNLNYIIEDKPLGTGGSLALLKKQLNGDFFVSNCDILIDADYNEILKFHKENSYSITMITSLQEYTVPYGVIHLDKNGTVDHLQEKPTYDFLTNTGMYVINSEVLDLIPENEFFHITDLIEEVLKLDKNVGVFPISADAWMDMGQFDEMDKMLKKLGINNE